MQKTKIVLISLFNGASIASLATSQSNLNIVSTYTSEVDKYALIHEDEKFPNNVQLGDVSKIDFIALRKEIISKHGQDVVILLMGGSPCQNLSPVGDRTGIPSLEDYLSLKGAENEVKGQSKLFWEFVRAKNQLKPDFFFLENVAKMGKETIKIFNQALNCTPIQYDSALVSAQERKRLYWFNWSVPFILDRGIRLQDVLIKDSPFRALGKWVYSKWGKRTKMDRLRTVEAKKSFTLTTSNSHPAHYYLNPERTMYRNLNPNEFEALQTFPKDWTRIDGISNTQRFRLIGNSWTLEIIKEILKTLNV